MSTVAVSAKPPFVPPLEPNWFMVLADLQNAGLANAEVARRLDLDARDLRRWKAGENKPNAAAALKLLAFHRWVME
jgi:hypothetical protein